MDSPPPLPNFFALIGIAEFRIPYLARPSPSFPEHLTRPAQKMWEPSPGRLITPPRALFPLPSFLDTACVVHSIFMPHDTSLEKRFFFQRTPFRAFSGKGGRMEWTKWRGNSVFPILEFLSRPLSGGIFKAGFDFTLAVAGSFRLLRPDPPELIFRVTSPLDPSGRVPPFGLLEIPRFKTL